MLYFKRNDVRENFWKELFNFDSRSELLRTDIKEDEENYFILMDIPGVKKEDINLEVNNGYLIVTVSREQETEKFIRNERQFGSCERSFYIGNVDENAINAKSVNGVLTLTVPKENARKIEKKTVNIDWQ